VSFIIGVFRLSVIVVTC